MNSQIILNIIEKEKKLFLDKNNDVELIKKYYSFKKMRSSFLFTIFLSLTSLPVWVILILSQILLSKIFNLTYLYDFPLTLFLFCIPISIFLTLNSFKAWNIFLFNKSKNNTQARYKLISEFFEDDFLLQEVNDEVKNLIKITLTDDEYFELLEFDNAITYQSALYILKEKARKENAIIDKRSVVLDLKKLKEYGIQVVNK